MRVSFSVYFIRRHLTITSEANFDHFEGGKKTEGGREERREGGMTHMEDLSAK
jgi:hypothetical protein